MFETHRELPNMSRVQTYHQSHEDGVLQMDLKDKEIFQDKVGIVH
uniref:Uncharacterized protein n=1 Tax=Brassica oleracea TaxID=3712 RepID=A0A3P6EZM4_BRAOL|nr:unnamed protein product [Brassica oleracea]